MTVDLNECEFETFKAPLGPEYGVAAGRVYPGVRVTHIPTGTVAEHNTCPLEIHNRIEVVNLLANKLASPEQKVLVDAMSWSNANIYFAGSEHATNNETDLLVAADILRGLEHLGWKLTRLT